MIRLYGLKTCDTCRKAQTALQAAGQTVSFIDVRESAAEELPLETWLAQFGADRLVNRRSTSWRNLDDDERARADHGDAAGLLGEHPTLIKRPVIDAGGQWHLGWSGQVRAALGLD